MIDDVRVVTRANSASVFVKLPVPRPSGSNLPLYNFAITYHNSLSAIHPPYTLPYH
jgi:hypothetical protein